MFGFHPEVAGPVPSEGFIRVAECLYRRSQFGIYYALVKKGGKQFRRSLKTTDRKLAERRLPDFRSRVGRLNLLAGGRHLTFEDLATRWMFSVRGNLKASSATRRETCIRMLNPFFTGTTVRNLSMTQVEEWAATRGPRIAAQSFNIERETLTQILEYARREGLILDQPCEGSEAPQGAQGQAGRSHA